MVLFVLFNVICADQTSILPPQETVLGNNYREISQEGADPIAPTVGPEDENDGELVQEQIAQVTVVLQGFGNRDTDPNLKTAFQNFIATLPSNTIFPIKIDRTKRWNGPNEYSVGSVTHDNSMFFGDRESNRSISVGGQRRLSEQFTIELELMNQLNLEQWISKIVIMFDQNNQRYIVQKFGVAHSVYRGVTNTGPAVLPWYLY
jgi:hypothetical protein